jgi:hypothetical protein
MTSLDILRGIQHTRIGQDSQEEELVTCSETKLATLAAMGVDVSNEASALAALRGLEEPSTGSTRAFELSILRKIQLTRPDRFVAVPSSYRVGDISKNGSATTPKNLAPFLPRRNKDGSFSSIRAICFVTTGGAWDKIELRNLELPHVRGRRY